MHFHKLIFLKASKLVIGLNSAFIHGKNFLEENSSESIPSGVICMWSGQSSNIPSGWALCNGQNGTPNLQDRFIVGAGNQYSVGATGGSATRTLSTSNMPAHTHIFNGSVSLNNLYGIARNGVESGYGSVSGSGMALAWESVEYCTSREKIGVVGGNGSVSGSITSSGSGASFSIMPPYYALCFIMKL